MGIRGEDRRRVIRPIQDRAEFNSFPLTAVTAVDTIFPVPHRIFADISSLLIYRAIALHINRFISSP